MSGTVEVKAAGAPGALPRTGGEDAPVEFVLGALALLAMGTLLMLRVWRRRA